MDHSASFKSFLSKTLDFKVINPDNHDIQTGGYSFPAGCAVWKKLTAVVGQRAPVDDADDVSLVDSPELAC